MKRDNRVIFEKTDPFGPPLLSRETGLAGKPGPVR